MLEIGLVAASPADSLRLLVVPAIAWAAWSDLRTRRITNTLWPPLVAVGVVALLLDGWVAYSTGGPMWREFATISLLSVGVLVPLAYVFWHFGGFGGADAKAVMTLAVVFPAYPAFHIAQATFPVSHPTSGLFALTILTNAVLLGIVYPGGLALRNAISGNVRPMMFLGRPVAVTTLVHRPGRLLESPHGFDRQGLDLDALRMYIRWRKCTLAELRRDPDRFRTTQPEDPGDPGDGAIADGGRTEDPWAAEAFLADAGGAYGTTPEVLRDGLDLISSCDRVWYSPGIPFVVFLAAGLAIALGYGDLFLAFLQSVGFI